MEENNKIMYKELKKTALNRFIAGKREQLFSNWGELKINGFMIEFTEASNYESWSMKDAENLCIVQDGFGVLVFNNREYEIKTGDTFKIFPGQEPRIIPQTSVKIFSVQMPSNRLDFPGEDLEILNIRRMKHIPSMVYEYEALGQEFFTPKYEEGLGLVRFVFPINNIPIHIHPHADRIILPVAGRGFTYAEPKRYEMFPGTFCMFPRGTKHTNGPKPGHVYDVWAVQLPWVESKIDEKNIAGDKEFVKYVETVPPKALWKTTRELKEAVIKLRGSENGI
jgi:quercetin dioxygenase-like cupin family protein